MAGRNISASRRPAADADERGAGAEAGEAPADAKDRGAEQQPAIDVIPRGEPEFRGERRRRHAQHEPERDGRHRDGAGHHECERGIEIAGQVEESEDHAAVRHAGDCEAAAEERAGGKCREDSGFHAGDPSRWRIT